MRDRMMYTGIILNYIAICLIACVSSAPSRGSRSLVPFWHLPCGELIEPEGLAPENMNEELASTLDSIKLQHQLTLTDYLNRDYEFLYERVRIGVHQHQYIPNWVPGAKDVTTIRRLSEEKSEAIISYLPKLHLDLQKFAVAFEEVIDDEPSEKVAEALRSTQSYLRMMLCEVESDIAILPGVTVPGRVERSIMAAVEREPVDETRRLVRDWGVLLKYKDYLHAWRHALKY